MCRENYNTNFTDSKMFLEYTTAAQATKRCIEVPVGDVLEATKRFSFHEDQYTPCGQEHGHRMDQ